MNRTLRTLTSVVLLLVGSRPFGVRSQVPINRLDAIDYPSRHAWDLFLLLNHPAKE